MILALLLAGCKSVGEIRPDTIVDIPLKPTQSADDTVTEETETITEKPTRLPAPELPTAPETIPQEAVVPTPPKVSDYAGLDRAVADAVNAFRRENGLPQLTLDARLCTIASVRAGEIAVFWSDSRPGGAAGITVLDDYGYSYAHAAEVLYFGAGRAEDALDRWLATAHGREGLTMDAAAIGVGVCAAPDGLVYVAALIAG